MQRHHLAVALEPRPSTWCSPRRARHKGRNVRVVVAHCIPARRQGMYMLFLGFADETRDVAGNVLAEGEDGAVTNGAVGAEESCRAKEISQ